MGSNIFILAIDYKFSKQVAKKLSDALDMFFLDVNDLISYSICEEAAKNRIGISYYEKKAVMIAMTSLSYENTVVNFPYDIYLKDEVENAFNGNNQLRIFLKLNQKQADTLNKHRSEVNKNDVALLTLKELNMILTRGTLTVEVDSLDVDTWVQAIIDKLKALN